jgi:hypothetical protein
MHTNHAMFRIIGVIALVCFIHGVVLPAAAWGQAPECPYDRTKPSLDNARISFKSLDYHCAEQEIMDYLDLTDLEKKKLVVNQFKEAFRAYRDWRGELDISSTEFIEMMNEAKQLVDEEESKKEAEPVVTEPTPAEEQPVVTQPPAKEQPEVTSISTGESKPWYKQWWAIALGVGVVAGAVVLAAGGGGEEGEGGGGVIDTLPSAPDVPSKR